MGRNLSPKAWRRYWLAGIPVGIVVIVVGIADGAADLIVLGVCILAFVPAMVAFWRRVGSS
jgi:hypothetical protein